MERQQSHTPELSGRMPDYKSATAGKELSVPILGEMVQTYEALVNKVKKYFEQGL